MNPDLVFQNKARITLYLKFEIGEKKKLSTSSLFFVQKRFGITPLHQNKETREPTLLF